MVLNMAVCFFTRARVCVFVCPLFFLIFIFSLFQLQGAVVSAVADAIFVAVVVAVADCSGASIHFTRFLYIFGLLRFTFHFVFTSDT